MWGMPIGGAASPFAVQNLTPFQPESATPYITWTNTDSIAQIRIYLAQDANPFSLYSTEAPGTTMRLFPDISTDLYAYTIKVLYYHNSVEGPSVNTEFYVT